MASPALALFLTYARAMDGMPISPLSLFRLTMRCASPFQYVDVLSYSRRGADPENAHVAKRYVLFHTVYRVTTDLQREPYQLAATPSYVSIQ